MECWTLNRNPSTDDRKPKNDSWHLHERVRNSIDNGGHEPIEKSDMLQFTGQVLSKYQLER